MFLIKPRNQYNKADKNTYNKNDENRLTVLGLSIEEILDKKKHNKMIQKIRKSTAKKRGLTDKLGKAIKEDLAINLQSLARGSLTRKKINDSEREKVDTQLKTLASKYGRLPQGVEREISEFTSKAFKQGRNRAGRYKKSKKKRATKKRVKKNRHFRKSRGRY